MWDVKVMILVDPVPHTPSRALQVLEKDTKKKMFQAGKPQT